MSRKITVFFITLALLFNLTPFTSAVESSDSGISSQVSTSGYHTGFIDQSGTLWMWGANGAGQLGNGTQIQSDSPVKVMDNVAYVECGLGYTAAIKTDGSLWMWGNNKDGKLGIGSGGNTQTEQGVMCQSTPVKVMDDVSSIYLSSDYDFTAAIKTDGSLWTWGSNQCGSLGNGGAGNSFGYHSDYGQYTVQTTPVKVLDSVRTFLWGARCGVAIKYDDSLWMWGYKGDAISLYGYDENILTPVKVMDNVDSISMSLNDVAVLKTDGSLWLWGVNAYGEIGDGSTKTRTTPYKVLNSVESFCLSYYRVAAIKTDGSLWTWGINDYGTLGNGGVGNTVEHGVVCQTTPIKLMDNVASIELAPYHSAAIKTDGTLWMWGNNEHNQLGNGGKATGTFEINGRWYIVPQIVPVKILDDVSSVNLESINTAAIKSDGSLWMWGENGYGQLGTGSFADSSYPAKVIDAPQLSETTNPDDNTGIAVYIPGMFSDVPLNSWYESSLAKAYELGLVKGASASTFSPTGNLTLAETITFASRLFCNQTTGTEEFAQGSPWYQVYVDYAVDNGIIKSGEFTNLSAYATRGQVAHIFANALPSDKLKAINEITALPDVDENYIYCVNCKCKLDTPR